MPRMHRMIAALFLAVSAAPAPALALPAAGINSNAPSIVVPVSGCHGDVRMHHVPGAGQVPHYHRPGDCRPIIVQRRQQERRATDCHGDARRHYVPGYGVVLHRHVGRDCAIRIVRRSTTNR